jgi:GT2 family glycosyltransferase
MSLPGRLSVIVPTHNTRALTLRCVETLAAEGTDGLEILVVDDGSSDGTAEALAAAHPQVRVVRNVSAVGFTRAANLGMAQAGGDLLLLLNSDTEVAPGAFAPLLAAFASDPRLGAAGAVLHYPDGSPQWSGGSAPTPLWLFGLASGLPPLLARLPFWRRIKPVGAGAGRVEWVTGAALALRRQAWEEAGGFDESFRFYGQDLDLCLRLRDAGWKVEIVPELRVLHHHGATIGSRSHLELLWTDLLRWARKYRGAGFARRVALALRSGAALRRLGLTAALAFVPADRREAWRAESEALRRATDALRGLSRE